MTVRSMRSRRRRRWTAAINAMNGALVIAAVVAVIEIGSPVANNLGLSVGPMSTAGQVAGSQFLQNAAAPSWEQPAASDARVNAPGSVVALPTTAEALAANITSGTGPSVPTPTRAVHPAVTASPKVAPTPGHAPAVAAIVSSPARGDGAADAAPRADAHGPPVGSGLPPAGQSGESAGAAQRPPGGAPGPDAGPAPGGPMPMPPPRGGAVGRPASAH
jgi:hypothetical protein